MLLLFLRESIQNETKLKHLEHPEDLHFNSGEFGANHAIDSLLAVHEKLKNPEKESCTIIYTKIYGSPSLVFGHHPENGNFFVATKSLFNKTPKINYSDSDIDKNHPKELGDILKHALKHLKKVSPKSGLFQGDIMHLPHTKVETERGVSFKHNLLNYRTDGNKEETRKAKEAKIGIAVHTKYTGNDLQNMNMSALDIGEKDSVPPGFSEHPDVHFINHATPIKKINSGWSAEFGKSISKAKKLKDDMTRNSSFSSFTQDVASHISTHINSMVRNGGIPSTDSLLDHIKERKEKEVSKLKTQSAKDKTANQHDLLITHIRKNRNHFDSGFELHEHLQNAKDALINHLDGGSKFKQDIGGKETAPEGYVVHHKGIPTKLVNRQEFSKANFELGAFRKNLTNEK